MYHKFLNTFIKKNPRALQIVHIFLNIFLVNPTWIIRCGGVYLFLNVRKTSETSIIDQGDNPVGLNHNTLRMFKAFNLYMHQ